MAGGEVALSGQVSMAGAPCSCQEGDCDRSRYECWMVCGVL